MDIWFVDDFSASKISLKGDHLERKTPTNSSAFWRWEWQRKYMVCKAGKPWPVRNRMITLHPPRLKASQPLRMFVCKPFKICQWYWILWHTPRARPSTILSKWLLKDSDNLKITTSTSALCKDICTIKSDFKILSELQIKFKVPVSWSILMQMYIHTHAKDFHSLQKKGHVRSTVHVKCFEQDSSKHHHLFNLSISTK